MQSSQLSEDDIKFVDELAYKAGQMALAMREGVGVHTKSGPSDLVTDADLKISRLIIEALAGRFPNDLIVSEEDKHEHTEGEPTPHSRIWLIDPIDGTENYVKQDGQYSSMIGLIVDGHPHYGWIYQPSAKTLFSGGPAYGAFKRIDGGSAKRYQEMPPLLEKDVVRIMMGWGDRRRHPWVMNLPNVQFVQSQSLGLKIMKVLEGEADVFISLTGRVKLWDTAAPAAIALGNHLDAGTVEGAPLPYPLPKIQHGSSVIIGKPGAIAWAARHIEGHSTRSVPKTFR